ncbi:sigma-70 family RNA polymerase sigma factor [uncultured Cyclobacterium sp.]|uniref:RNA polymerase sigma factor n=1 Tax=uncultured Cyclobacterium sp. TaxID=453820 RepID=UPI0030EB2FBE|tara:strand:+ start:208 stop:825 length:618 start_codon:yes stop_codon:yes gene_type:complete
MYTKSFKGNTIDHSNDLILWQKVKNGDKNGLESLYLRYSRDLYTMGMSIKQDNSLIKDCIHDVFLTIWNSRKRLGNTDNIRLYLFKCLSHKIYKEVGKDKKRYSTQSLEDYEEVALLDNFECFDVETDELKRKNLLVCIDKLPLRQKEIIHYLFFDNHSYDDITHIMGLNLQSAYTLAWKAINTLKKKMLIVFFLMVVSTLLFSL